ncbi:PREDICTED: vinorine synthase [Tarenaya hassleriana]|uniref:vinorine synthase n=1 Tax=Tarenaya hassleriana TaxID=28532 RepID=UPI00053C77B3|nr:PREDICTED: vinorine synthase [Tarenaya hassleriana]
MNPNMKSFKDLRFLFSVFLISHKVYSFQEMEFQVSVISRELIKPSSATHDDDGDRLLHHLSFLDQLAPPIFMPFVFFYTNGENLTRQERTDRIKRSLSETLNLFYPLAGRVRNSNGSCYVECNGEGVPFIEAKAGIRASQILENPNPNELNKFLPFEFHEVSEVALTVQVTSFESGGIALGIGFCHKLCDAFSGLEFVRNWAAIARRDSENVDAPCLDLSKMFPQCDMSDLDMSTGIMKENILTRRFVFLNSSVESLRERFSGGNVRATRVEALSVFIWSRFMASIGAEGNPDRNGKIYTMLHPVNLRKQAEPAMPDNLFGNLMRFSVTVPKISRDIDDETGCSIVKQMRKEIKRIDAGYVKKLQEDRQEHLEFLKRQASGFVRGEIVSFSFTSLCNFPLYESDFGWGKPSWVASARMSFKNLVAFFDTKQGDGIEAWINLDEVDMSRFESDQELLSYVSSDPSVNLSETHRTDRDHS